MKTAQWVWVEKLENGDDKYVCSNCKCYKIISWLPDLTPYCAECGAKITERNLSIMHKIQNGEVEKMLKEYNNEQS